MMLFFTSLKSALRVSLCLVLLLSSTNSQAALTVIDPAAISKLLVTIKKMETQIKHLESQIKLVQGNTGFSSILENTVAEMHSFVPATVPTDFSQVFNTGSGVAGLKMLANQLKDKHQLVKADQVFTDSSKDVAAKKAFDDQANFIYANMAFATNAYNLSGNRKNQLGQLVLAVQSATQPKERDQLMARIMAENTLILNDLQQTLALQLLVTMHKESNAFNTKAVRDITLPVKMDY